PVLRESPTLTVQVRCIIGVRPGDIAMDRMRRHWTLSAAGALAWFAFGVLPAAAQELSPSFRPSIPMISPLRPRDPTGHAQPGNLSNIPMGGGTTATGTTSNQTNRRTIKKVKQVVTRGPSTNSKITSQSITASGGSRGTGGGSSGTGGGVTGGS